MSLRQITLGSLAMSSVSILRMALQLFILPVLARYLSPSDYGIVAMAMPFVVFAMMFSDAGMSASLIRTSSKNREEWSTSFWLTIILGLILVTLISLIGYIASIFLSEPLLAPVIAALSLTVFFQSVSAVPGASLQQEHRFSTVALIEISSMVISLICAVLVAINGGGVWALVVQQIAQFLPRLTFTFIFSSFRPSMIFHIDLIKDHLIFGRNMLGINFINFIRQIISNMAMGKVLGTAPIGLFSMASGFADISARIVSGPIQNVLYPRVASLKDDHKAIQTLFLFATKVISILVIPTIGLLAVAHEPVFTIVLSQKWTHAGIIFMALAPGAAVQTVTALRSTLAMAYAKTDILMRQTIESAIIGLIALAITIAFGIEWIALGLSIIAILYIPRSLQQIIPLINLDLKTYIDTVATPILTTVTAIVLYLAITTTINFTNWEEFALGVILGGFTVLISTALQIRELKEDISYLRGNLAKTLHPHG